MNVDQQYKVSCKFEGTCCKGVTFTIKAFNYISARGKMCVSFCLEHIGFYGGCAANLKAIARLMEGRMIYGRRMAFFDDIECGDKGTSCPAQFQKCVNDVIDNILEKTEENGK